MAPIKVYAGSVTIDGKQRSAIIAATSRAQVVALLNRAGLRVTVSEMAKYWTITGNKEDVAMAAGSAGTIFLSPSMNSREYTPFEVEA